MPGARQLQVSSAEGGGSEGAVQTGSYRVVPETEGDIPKHFNSNMVKDKEDNCADGADEKMLAEDEKKLALKSDLADVKFERQNGDTKVDILEMKKAFTGLTKEELMRYCNDPFWVRLRWFVFILFWLIWLGMLAGAVYIIIEAPKCAPPPPKTWWQMGPLVDLDEPTDAEINDPQQYFTSLEDMIPILRTFKGVHISESLNPGDDAYSEVIEAPSNVTEFKNFAIKAKEHNIRVIVDLTPNFVNKTNDWFIKSERKEKPYDDYFVWANAKFDEKLQKNGPPNNWVSTKNVSAWTFSNVRDQYYLHQFDKDTPDLNFNNTNVVKEFDKVLQFWIKNGASGVRLKNVKHLLVDMSLTDELRAGVIGAVHTDYSYYKHDKTTNLIGVSDILAHWRAVILEHTEGQGLLTLKEDLKEVNKFIKYNGTLIVDLPKASNALTKNLAGLNAKLLQDSLNNVFNLFGNDSWPSWKYNAGRGSMSSELRIIATLLPGVPVVSLSQVTETGNNSTTVDEEYKSLLNLRGMPSMMYGAYNSTLLAKDAVFAYTRLKSGNPGFAILFNPTDELLEVNMSSLHKMPEEVTVNLMSKNYQVKDVFPKGKLHSTKVPISSNSAIILTYVQED